MPSNVLNKVKLYLGITNTSKDEIIQNQIDAAETELLAHGLDTINETDPLTIHAIMLYCAWSNNFQGDAERYWLAFERLANGMAKNGEYRNE